jgi:hypothetical protein
VRPSDAPSRVRVRVPLWERRSLAAELLTILRLLRSSPFAERGGSDRARHTGVRTQPPTARRDAGEGGRSRRSSAQPT